MPAREMVSWVRAHRHWTASRVKRSERVLDDEYVEFSGGTPRNPSWPFLRQRSGDSEAPATLVL
jgi:hypothetical protein